MYTKQQQPIPDNAKIVFKGKIFDVYQWEQEMFDGSKKAFEKLKRPDTVCVFGVLDNSNILLIKQTQPGRLELIESIGGRVDEGEMPQEAARREFKEEIGMEIGELIPWISYYPLLKIDWGVHYFIARDLVKVTTKEDDYAGEDIKTVEYSFDDFINLSYNENFAEKEIIPELLKCLISKQYKQDIKKLFKIE